MPKGSVGESEPHYEVIGEAESPYAELDMVKDRESDVSLTTNTAYQQIPNKGEKDKRGQNTSNRPLALTTIMSLNFMCRCWRRELLDLGAFRGLDYSFNESEFHLFFDAFPCLYIFLSLIAVLHHCAYVKQTETRGSVDFSLLVYTLHYVIMNSLLWS